MQPRTGYLGSRSLAAVQHIEDPRAQVRLETPYPFLVVKVARARKQLAVHASSRLGCMVGFACRYANRRLAAVRLRRRSAHCAAGSTCVREQVRPLDNHRCAHATHASGTRSARSAKLRAVRNDGTRTVVVRGACVGQRRRCGYGRNNWRQSGTGARIKYGRSRGARHSHGRWCVLVENYC